MMNEHAEKKHGYCYLICYLSILPALLVMDLLWDINDYVEFVLLYIITVAGVEKVYGFMIGARIGTLHSGPIEDIPKNKIHRYGVLSIGIAIFCFGISLVSGCLKNDCL
uniref:Uncharacterized protein n=1 Tax=Magnetococcus massalia (strain MO-1) TaxID=451514 RepID=A0A1S7LFZ7_MAGMO|nr:Membrane protein of unknown function [Candidatus Magnetococcus massalia]